MPTIREIISGREREFDALTKRNFEMLYGRVMKDSEDVWKEQFRGLTWIEVGLRVTKEVARELGLSTHDLRVWHDGRHYVAVPLSIKGDGSIEIPEALKLRDDWLILVKFITHTVRGGRLAKQGLYTCCLTNDPKKRGLYAIDNDRGRNQRSHSIVYYKTYGQMKWCEPGTENNSVKVRPMNLIHVVGDPEGHGVFRVILQQLMLERRKGDDGWAYKLNLKTLVSFRISEGGHDDGHGARLLPADIRSGLTGQFEWLTTAVRDTHRVLLGDDLPVFADLNDPFVTELMKAIWGPAI